MPEEKNQLDAYRYRLAQANKLIRLGTVRRDSANNLFVDQVMLDELDSPVTPDEIDFRF